MDFQFFKFGAIAGLPLQRRGQRDFSKARAGEHDGVADNVVRQRRVRLRIQLVFPGVIVLLHGVTQQGMHQAA